MDDRCFLILAGVLVGTGVGAAFFRKNILAVLLSLFSVCYGAVLIFLVFSKGSSKINEVLFFLLCMCGLVVGVTALGFAQAYRRYRAVGAAELDHRNELRN